MSTISRKEKEKLAREKDIINAAEKVFTVMGYNDASMEAIAKEAQFTRKTLYQYFTDKEDLLFTVIIRGFERLLCTLKNAVVNGNNGYDKLKHLINAYCQFYKEAPNTLNLMNYIGYIKPTAENTAKRIEFNKVSEQLAHEIAKIIDEGKADGSIRSDFDTMRLTHSAEFLITGFFHMFSISGKTFTEHFLLNEDDFINFSMNLLCDIFHEKK
ncbi:MULTISPECIES: TetR/AcrR family transcriptional regulator [Clostridium]|uniref:TetR family transcriptional regulator n=1 Tax=Clostridium beijerinckii TaxID=1520 RepID=A0A1S9N811_CLOBE|nr:MULTISPECIES: TetR/AcrR family transcriptional regulator [Clostridium]MBN7577151.1 TetR/AcrR family transcriptional regulator [Clostridium beijerinckii]MBN7579826.1 TetR/AcrR family transcriptional regulator [Clostridium beijerinckii]MBN7586917.1 TetR/AcrR family transcriptional regulator [Clostridium beijerinckii]MBO0523127.1 TetR/AcrR family transcriptional regulator [Clostridium beijerinckii]MZK51001.1 TetR family transcriptional regulator [Clostridium beijerinckii]